MSVEVRVHQAHAHRRPAPASVARVVRFALRTAGVAGGAVSVVFVGSRRCRTLNRDWLGHDEVTDVISFPLGEPDRVEGEVYVNLDRARTQSRAYGVPEREEVARLVAHGVLHLAGHDDRTAREARRMREAEDRTLAAVRRGRAR